MLSKRFKRIQQHLVLTQQALVMPWPPCVASLPVCANMLGAILLPFQRSVQPFNFMLLAS